MKKLSYLVAATAAIATLGFTQNTRGGDVLLSPHARELQPHIVPGSSAHDPDLTADRPNGDAKVWTRMRSMQTVPSTGPDIDLAHGARPTLSAKDPRFEVALRANAVREFDVAPLK